MSCKIIYSINTLIGEVTRDLSTWGYDTVPWFRGEPRNISKPLLPRLFRHKGDDKKHDENKLLQYFRMKAPSLGLPYVPSREYTDQWLFLAQHVGLPTRLLDWTEGLLIALHFALYSNEDGAIIWMLNPNELNRRSVSANKDEEYALTWYRPAKSPLDKEDLETIQELIEKDGKIILPPIHENLGSINIHMAWTQDKISGTTFPVAIHPTNIHPRMSSQISRFTIHGKKETDMCQMELGLGVLRKYSIADEAIPGLKQELRMLGIIHSSLFPELDGLSTELAEAY